VNGPSQQLIVLLLVVAVFIGILAGWALFGAMTGGGPAPSGVGTALLA
jgi:hypothetical protein